GCVSRDVAPGRRREGVGGAAGPPDTKEELAAGGMLDGGARLPQAAGGGDELLQFRRVGGVADELLRRVLAGQHTDQLALLVDDGGAGVALAGRRLDQDGTRVRPVGGLPEVDA